MKQFIDLLTPQTDKADLGELIMVKKHLPERVTERVPDCLYRRDPKDPDNEDKATLDREVLLVMAWVRARRDVPEITIEEVGARIGVMDQENFPDILKEIHYFYTTFSRQEVEDHFARQLSAEESDDENSDAEKTGETPENPILPKPLKNNSKS